MVQKPSAACVSTSWNAIGVVAITFLSLLKAGVLLNVKESDDE